MQLFIPLNRTQGLVSSAEALGVGTEAERRSPDKAKHSPPDRAALYRLVRCCLHVTQARLAFLAGTFSNYFQAVKSCLLGSDMHAW